MLERFKRKNKNANHAVSAPQARDEEHQALSNHLDDNQERLLAIFDHCDDVNMRPLTVRSVKEPLDALLIYVEGMTDKDLLERDIMRPLMSKADPGKTSSAVSMEKISRDLVGAAETMLVSDLLQVVDSVVSGNVALLLDGFSEAIILDLKAWESRSIDEPATEPVVRGPRDGFTETLRTNIMLVRRRIKTSRLKVELLKVGSLSKTDVAVVYIKGVANDKVVNEVKERLGRIKIDGILESGYLEEFIEDTPFSPFPQVNNTERPDKVAGGLLEGLVAIITDTTPFVLTVPSTFPQFLQASEDYYNRYPYASLIRLLRFIALNITLLLPSLYVAVITFHQEMLPTPLLISIASQREGIPFPAVIEALMMEFTFEILREAGTRLPRAVGPAVSIVGALVIGDAAIRSGLVSPIMVMVVASTAVASFTIPTTSGSFSVRLLRFPLMIMAATLGLFGVMTGLLALLIHLCTLRSFGVPYLSPIAPLSVSDLKDTWVRAPWWAMITRPRVVGFHDPVRQPKGQKPSTSKQNSHRRGDRK
ncbi:MAG: spore germination protein [Bacillota bacterium]